MTTPTHRLVIIRHGETDWSAEGRHTGSTDLPLNATGVSQAASLAAVVDALDMQGEVTVLASPRARAQRTAQLAGLTVSRTEPDLGEWDYGDYEGITSAEIHRTVPDWTVWTHGGPDGESPEQIAARADRVLAEAAVALERGDVVLVGHGHFGAALTARYLQAPISFGRHFHVLPASATVLAYDAHGVPQLRAFGRTGYASESYAGR
ncbi:histidine phosphatase family protein [Tsukamurella sp. 8F]|uniref:histidine phosphatase family protein n=1 Tax=unclassified Tsukamurella TaxID=2633480 RepID=UPI0023B97417|nr:MULTISPECIES: histidine phosphatase family protein [unclassified Tsukamurella]MDF0528921.1 histidine phosphatase family protein [Tsukamurella sp. 8J]MDF0586756.1 histidine phosphatase family protein [Tsukamurella sp. 8F]